jgi:UDP-N-acetylmuramate dehydrogenase
LELNKFIEEKFLNWLIQHNIEFFQNIKLSSVSWLKAGGVARIIVYPKNISECQKILKFLHLNNIKFLTIGNLSNILFRDGKILTPMISLRRMNSFKNNENNKHISIEAEAGLSITKFSNSLLNLKINGVEGLIGIPGNIGGGIAMNASSYSSELCTFLSYVIVLDKNGDEIRLKKESLNLQWRSSIFLKNQYLIISAVFTVPKKHIFEQPNTKLITERIKNHRKEFQEKKLPNLGSLFATKNIYKDLSKKNFIFLLLFLFNKIGTAFFYSFNKKNFFNFRKFMILVYLYFLGLQKYKYFTSSEKTLNCLVNKGSLSSQEAVHFVRDFEKKTKDILRLENIIIDDVK